MEGIMTTNRKPLQKYNPGSLDETDTETLKLGILEELWDISTNFVQTDEILGDAHQRIDTLEIDRENVNAKFEEVINLSVEGDEALAERITTLSTEISDADKALGSQIEETNKVVSDLKGTVATNKIELESSISDAVGALTEKDKEIISQAEEDLKQARKDLAEAISSGDADAAKKLQEEIDRLMGIISDTKTEIEAKLSVTNQTVANLDKALSQQITDVQANFNGQIAGVNQTISAQADKLGKVEAKWGVTTNVNGKVTGVSMNNDGKTGTFAVQADRFTISDGTSDATVVPFEVVGAHTRIRSAYINSIQSDNWNGSNVGWAITRDGWASFNNVTVRGAIYATTGVFENVVINSSCVYNGTISSNQIQDTAVTAANKVSGSGPGTSGSPNHTLTSTVVSGTVVNARPYNRVLYVTYPGIITVGGYSGPSGSSKQFTVTVDLVYNGAVISAITVKDWRPNTPGTTFEFTAAIAGVIPANTTGSYAFRVNNFTQDRYPSIDYTSQVCLAAIYKASNEIT